ncbi:MAG: lipid-A-disaccharide synthase, partial [Psychromonas sp.]|nr:lipid-A-disaccharide synthase [Psychromonas sp.]
MSESSKKLMIITGEVSGDLIGAALVKELKSLKPHLNIIGIGGDKMREEGMELIYHSDQMAFLGFIEVVKHLPFIRKVQKKLIDVIKDEEIKHVVLIDYPGFNLSIAKKLKPLGVKVIYYVSPQIWAWAKGRIKKVKKYV